MRDLSLLETRVLSVLVEKSLTVPDTYPLSMNALLAGCNQRTARDPVLQASEADLQEAIDGLKSLHLVLKASGSRVARYEHDLGRALGLPSQSVALLALLMLRGPQTVSELRSNADRLHRFADASSVEGFLEELAGRSEEMGGPLVSRLPKAPGAREPRWCHCLGAEQWPQDAPHSSAPPAPASAAANDEMSALRAQQQSLQAQVEALQAQVEWLCAELGLQRPA